MREIFTEPAENHPLYDATSQRRITEYRKTANNLYHWIRERIHFLEDQFYPSSLTDLKKLATDSIKFKNEEMQTRYNEKQYLTRTYHELSKSFENFGEVDIEPEMHIETLDRWWSQLSEIQHEHDQAITNTIKRLLWILILKMFTKSGQISKIQKKNRIMVRKHKNLQKFECNFCLMSFKKQSNYENLIWLAQNFIIC